MVGKIQKFDELRGFGFIVNFRTRTFFHINQWCSDIPPQTGMTVTFDIIPAKKAGFTSQAANVVPTVEGAK
jgi:cold shock CspA family protein